MVVGGDEIDRTLERERVSIANRIGREVKHRPAHDARTREHAAVSSRHVDIDVRTRQEPRLSFEKRPIWRDVDNAQLAPASQSHTRQDVGGIGYGPSAPTTINHINVDGHVAIRYDALIHSRVANSKRSTRVRAVTPRIRTAHCVPSLPRR